MKDQTTRYYEFGPFRLDAAERQLSRGGARLPLTPKAFELLLALLENGGRVVSKDALLRKVWPDRCVEEANITQVVFVLRKLLGTDDGGRQYIETVPTRGYRFASRVTEVADASGNASEAGGRPGAAVGDGRHVTSIAVLPLANEGGEADLEYLCDGITETLINALSRLPHLKVMARSTVFRHRGTGADVRQIGRALDVQAVLIGRVLRSGGRLVISAEMVDAGDGSHVWGGRFVHPRADVLALVEEVAGEIVAGLRPKLTRGERMTLARRYTEDVEAYHLFMKGRYLWNKRSTKDILQAVEYFEQAARLDPNYAPAYVGLADSYSLLRTRAGLAPLAASPRIKLLLQKALELDETLAEAHASMGYFMTSFEWDWRGAEGEFRRAIELNPNCVTAHHWYSLYLRALGRSDEALAEIQSAQRLDPLSPIISGGVGMAYYFARQYERALAALRAALELDPNFPGLLGNLGQVYLQMGLHAEALTEHLRLTSVYDDHEAWTLLGFSYASTGQKGKATKILERLLAASRRGYIPPFYLALLYIGLGETDAAFYWLDRAYQSRDGDLTTIKVDPRMDGLMPDPRFTRLLRKLGLDA